jgi:diguanylate cyclase (GGDEF)-like protein
MLTAPIPLNEESRIAKLRELNILDTPPEERFDRLTRMARRLFSVPIAQVTLVDADRQWFKSSAGSDARQSPRDASLCAHAILDEKMLLVPNTLLDDRFFDNPMVTGEPGIRFYAGCPLTVGDERLGTLCVIDTQPREFCEEERQMLRDLAEMAEEELEAFQLATTDHLTSISNRRGFERLARIALLVCQRLGRPATLLFFDLNNFKQINDRFGHAEGDRALRTFAQGLLSVFRDSDVIARLGGDEFAVLLTGAGSAAAAEANSRLKTWLKTQRRIEEQAYEIEYSTGQLDFDPGKYPSIEELLAGADAAMYENKRLSREAGAER